jgi:hypothetical protein
LEIFAFFMLTGIFSTLLLPETKGRSLEELSNEEQDGFVQGISKSWLPSHSVLLTLALLGLSREVEVRDGLVVAQK